MNKVLFTIISLIVGFVFGIIFGLFTWEHYWNAVAIFTISFGVIGFFIGMANDTTSKARKKVEYNQEQGFKIYIEELEKKYGKEDLFFESKNNWCRLYVNARKIVINRHEYNFEELADVQLIEDISTSETNTIQKSNTGNTIGRAVIGGVIAGGVGAVIGGVTSKKEMVSNTISKKKYTVKITKKSLTDSTKLYGCGDNLMFASKLHDTIKNIISM